MDNYLQTKVILVAMEIMFPLHYEAVWCRDFVIIKSNCMSTTGVQIWVMLEKLMSVQFMPCFGP